MVDQLIIQLARQVQTAYNQKRLAAAVEIIEGGLIVRTATGWRVQGSGTAVYTVDAEGRCTCPDSLLHHQGQPYSCKHGLAALLLQGAADAQAGRRTWFVTAAAA